MWMLWLGWGLHRFIFNVCISKFLETTVERLYNPEKETFDGDTDVCPRGCDVSVFAPVDVHVVGGVLVCAAAMSSGGT